MEHPGFKEVVGRVWQQNIPGNAMHKIWKKLKQLKFDLKDLNTFMQSYVYKLNQARQQLEQVQAAIADQPLCQTLFDQEKELISVIEKWSTVEEKVLRHKSRACWIDSGDANSKYFHAQLKIRASRNVITIIYNEHWVKLTTPQDVEAEFMQFFVNLMGTSNDVMLCPNSEVTRKEPCLSLLQHQQLVQEITRQEIADAIKGMPSDKAPGVDGFPIEFFTKNWVEIGEDVYQAVTQFFTTGKMNHAWNVTAMTLVCKVHSPT
ncbi:uncharacterized protein LOC132611886 [Lycium barbarum]|uniref:uncharacterized protein LOC132611886 n=1 Tax=Lycium barbarum TaxID=112863 RepID=UPI00293E5878|nr:uncharacterized protein LOC132611886 [Lycium barbarum]